MSVVLTHLCLLLVTSCVQQCIHGPLPLVMNLCLGRNAGFASRSASGNVFVAVVIAYVE